MAFAWSHLGLRQTSPLGRCFPPVMRIWSGNPPSHSGYLHSDCPAADWEKWLGVQRKLDDELVQLALCDGDRERCVSPAALRFLAIVDNAKAREGRARLGEINRAINLAIHPMSDLAQYGEIAWLDFIFKLVKTMLHPNCLSYTFHA